MYDRYVIETSNGPAGIVVRDGRGFRFFASNRDFSSLDGHLFATPRAAQTAANDQLSSSRRRHSGPCKFNSLVQ
jgi:hypothetical protein